MSRQIWLAHDHMDRAEDFARDLAGGVTGKILHLTVDSWLDAPSREDFETTYYKTEGFLERGLAAAAKVYRICDDPANKTRIIRNFSDIETAQANGELALVLGNEGGKILGDNVELVDAWFRLGLRHVQFNWAMRNLIGASQSNENEPDQPGLTDFGREVVQRMNELGMVVDVSHSAPQTIKDILSITSKPILNSHSGSRVLADKQQNLWDEQIRDMADNGGVIGMHFCSRLVLGVNGVQSEIDDVVKQIRYVADKGGIDAVGLGPDWILGNPERDALYTRNTDQEDISWTRRLENSSEIGNLAPALEQAGFSESEIDKILGENMLRLLKDVLPGVARNPHLCASP